jgi:phosphoglycolate phosphatase-like HAD superfamily hydrolase
MEQDKKIPVKALLIDLDGTLVNSEQALLEATTTAYVAIGATSFDPRIGFEIARRMEQNLPVHDLLSNEYRNQRIIKKFLRTYIDAYYVSTLTKTKPIDHVYDTLQTLAGAYPLGLVTLRAIPKKQITKELGQLKLLEYFRTVITTMDVKNPKPYPDAVIKGAEQLGVSANHCAIVGDSIVDIEAGKAANAKTIAVLSGLYTHEELQKENPDLIVKNINYLPQFLQKT